MNYFDNCLNELCERNQTAGDKILINLFNKHYDTLGCYFDECVILALDDFDEMSSIKSVLEDIKYRFLNGLKSDIITSVESDLTLWAVINYEPTNFNTCLNRVISKIFSEIYCYQ